MISFLLNTSIFHLSSILIVCFSSFKDLSNLIDLFDTKIKDFLQHFENPDGNVNNTNIDTNSSQDTYNIQQSGTINSLSMNC